MLQNYTLLENKRKYYKEPVFPQGKKKSNTDKRMIR